MTFREFFITNTWWGKLIGAFFGYLIAGSTGAVFGILVGNFFDRSLSSYYSNPHWSYLSEKQKAAQNIFFEATFSVMGHLAKADGQVTEQELNLARRLMKEMRLDHEQKTRAKRLFNGGKQATFNLDPILVKLQTACHDNKDLLRLFIDIQYRAAQIDGLSEQKIKVLDTIFSKLGFIPFHKQYRFYEDFGIYTSREQEETPKQEQDHNTQYQSSSSSQSYSSYRRYNYQPNKSNLDYAYALIEVSPKASKQEVKQAYRRLLSRNHPDKLIAQGLPQEMIKIANEKTQKIVKAYELICTSKGW